MKKTRLQMLREASHVTVVDMAQVIVRLYGNDCGGDVNHMIQVISAIESGGMIPSPRPRKTYELKYITQYLTAKAGTLIQAEDIYG